MNSKNLLLVKSVISIVLAVFMIFFAITFLNWFLKSDIPSEFPPQADPAGMMPDLVGLAKLGFSYFGAMLAGVGVICFFASSATASVLRKRVMMGLAIGDAIGFVICLIAQLSGKFTGLGWILVVVWALLALAFAYFGFLEKED